MNKDQPNKDVTPPSNEDPRQERGGFNVRGMFTGRLNRLGYLVANVAWGLLIVAFCIVLLVIVKFSGGSQVIGIASVILIILALIMLETLAVGFAIRRLHDLNQSGWLTLLLFIPFVSYVVAIYLYFAPGTKGPNPYGSGPQNSLSFRDVSGF